MATVPLSSGFPLRVVSLKKSIPLITPVVSSSPLTLMLLDFCAPTPTKTASYPFFCNVLISKSFPISTPVLTSIPKSIIHLISESRIFFGSLYSGIPYLNIPPSPGNFSKIVTEYPSSVR